MTSRERLLAILRREHGVDRLGWSPLIDGYYMSSFPAGTDILDVFREIGADVMERHVYSWIGTIDKRRGSATRKALQDTGKVEYVANGVTVSIELRRTDQGTELTQSYGIPGRKLTARGVFTETSPYLPFPIENPIKNVEDLEAYEYIVKREVYEPNYEHFIAEDRRIGEAGIATDSGLTSPIQALLQHQIGIASFYTVFFIDHKEKVLSLMRAMHERNCTLYEVIARSPAEVVIDYENTSTTFISPDLYREYSLPIINDYADILHAKGKIMLTHRCGKLKGLLPDLKEGRDDGIADISPEPTGDVDIWDAKEVLPNKVVLGGIDPTFLAGWQPEQVAEYTRTILARSGGSDRLIIGSADAVPKNAKLENLKAVTAAIAQDTSHLGKISRRSSGSA